MDISSFHKYIALGVALLLYLFYSGEWRIKPQEAGKISKENLGTQNESTVSGRDIAEDIKRNDRECIVFFGSQTGTAEDFASRMAQEAKDRFGLKSMVADLKDYDFKNMDQIPKGKILIFVLATYGDGEPTDNAAHFYGQIASGKLSANTTPDALSSMQFCAFGLGNKTYEKYNWMVKSVSEILVGLGAQCIGEVGTGDDGAGTLEEDFLTWKDSIWPLIAVQFGLQEVNWSATRSLIYEISTRHDLSKASDGVFLGEPELGLNGLSKGPYTAQNPYLAPLSASTELFTNSDRNCVHMEVDLKGSNLSYTTGDHIAVWPNNPGDDVDSLVFILNLSEKRHQIINVKPMDQTAKVPFPCPTTIDAIFRYYLEICGPISRQSCAILSAFTPSAVAKEKMKAVAENKELFHKEVRLAHHNLASLLSWASDGRVWDQVPLSIIIESLTKLQPRYYSISSSSLAQPYKVSITVTVESKPLRLHGKSFNGVASNYLLALKAAQHGEVPPQSRKLKYGLYGPRQNRADIRIPIHLRHSNFRLPTDESVPIIMIGPGTGVAPFRGFTQERARQADQGRKIGHSMLFFGCRKPSEDFIYKSEWEDYKQSLGSAFELVTAFSREGPNKVYVQHKLKEYGHKVSIFLEQGAHIYICGEAATMAQQVHAALIQILLDERGLSVSAAERLMGDMKRQRRYQVCDYSKCYRWC